MKMLWALLFVWVVGSASHFFYEWSGENPLVGLLFASSESVWEHRQAGILAVVSGDFVAGKGSRANWSTLAWAMACGTLFYLVHQIGAFYAYTSRPGHHKLPAGGYPDLSAGFGRGTVDGISAPEPAPAFVAGGFGSGDSVLSGPFPCGIYQGKSRSASVLGSGKK